MKHGLILITLSMVMAACSSNDVSKSKVGTTNALSPHTITVEHTEIITEEEMNENDQDIQQLNNYDIKMQGSLLSSSQTGEEKESDLLTLSSEPQVDEKEETHAEDTIIIDDSTYINIMHEEKFQDWITVAKKYGATLYAIPYSDVFAIVKDGEVLVGMSTGVASATPNHIDILCDLMIANVESADKLIEGIKHVAQTGESVQLTGPQEFDDDYSIVKQDEWIVVSW
jgi:hypothetical protein